MLHDTPTAFQFPVSRSVRAGFFVAVVCLAAALVIVCWSWSVWPTGFVWQRMVSVAATCVWALASVHAFRQWQCSASGRLQWQRHGWAWQDAAGQPPQVSHVHTLDCVWDGQSFLVLRLQWMQPQTAQGAQQPRVHWLWLEQRISPELWGDMRRAVLYWRQRSQH